MGTRQPQTSMENVPLESGVKGKRPDPPAQAESVTMFIVECLENFTMNPLTSLVAKHLAAVYLFCCYAVMRVEQANRVGLMLFVTTNLLKDTFFSTRTHVVQKCNLNHSGHHCMVSQARNFGSRHSLVLCETFQISAIFSALLPAQMDLSKTLQVFYQAHSSRNMV